MANCPSCNSEIESDFGMIQCPNCNAMVFVDIDGNVSMGMDTKASVEAPAVVEESKPDSSPGYDNEFNDEAFGNEVSDEPQSSEDQGWGSPDPDGNNDWGSPQDWDQNEDQELGEQQESAISKIDPDIQAEPWGFDDPVEEQKAESVVETSVPEDVPPQSDTSKDTQDPMESDQAREPNFSQESVFTNKEWEPEEKRFEKNDLSEISEFANSEISAGTQGEFLYDLEISGVIGKFNERTLKDVLSDRKLLLSPDKLIQEAKDGIVKIRNLNTVKLMVILNSLQQSSFDARWRQKGIHTEEI